MCGANRESPVSSVHLLLEGVLRDPLSTCCIYHAIGAWRGVFLQNSENLFKHKKIWYILRRVRLDGARNRGWADG
jgi:hypothetical protein